MPVINLTTNEEVPVSQYMTLAVYDQNNNGIVDNAEKVNGYTVETNVPADAKFTDTVYEKPTSEPISYISSLREELDSKSNIGHTHPYEPINPYIVKDPNYIHTDNNFTDESMTKLAGLWNTIPVGGEGIYVDTSHREFPVISVKDYDKIVGTINQLESVNLLLSYSMGDVNFGKLMDLVSNSDGGYADTEYESLFIDGGKANTEY